MLQVYLQLNMYEFSDYIIKNKQFLNSVGKSRSKERVKFLLNSANEEQLLAIVEVIYNIMSGNFPLRAEQRRRLGKFNEQYKQIVKTRSINGARKKLQVGGQIGIIGSILAPVLGVLAQHWLDKSLNK